MALVFKGTDQRSFRNNGKDVLTLVESYQNCHQLESVIATTSATCLSNPSPINVLSLCDSSVNQWCFGDLTNVSLAVEDANSKIVDVKNVFVIITQIGNDLIFSLKFAFFCYINPFVQDDNMTQGISFP